MATLQEQARALGDPTRHRVFQYLVDADAPVGVAELTAHVGLNHNAVRQHLARLVEADLVVAGTAPPSGRGRPRLEYRVHPAADSRWGATGPYERLAVLLTELARSGDTPVAVGRRAGRSLLRAGAPVVDPVATMVDEMARQGFDPTVRRHGERLAVTLRTCPFASAVLTDRDVVCDLHLGLSQGLAEAVGGVEVEELVAQDPRRAGCRLTCRVTA